MFHYNTWSKKSEQRISKALRRSWNSSQEIVITILLISLMVKARDICPKTSCKTSSWPWKCVNSSIKAKTVMFYTWQRWRKRCVTSSFSSNHRSSTAKTRSQKDTERQSIMNSVRPSNLAIGFSRKQSHLWVLAMDAQANMKWQRYVQHLV